MFGLASAAFCLYMALVYYERRRFSAAVFASFLAGASFAVGVVTITIFMRA